VRRIEVAVAVIVRNDGRILITQRKADDSFAHLWEFPGGKCEPGESAEAALRREIREELAVDVTPTWAFARVVHQYLTTHVTLLPFECKLTDPIAVPRPLECQAMKWVTPNELPTHAFPSANAPLLRAVAARLSTHPARTG